MNCYDCARSGETNTAVAVCTACGAGTCTGCVRVEHSDHVHAASPGMSAAHRTRTLTCPSCDAAQRNESVNTLPVGRA